MYNPLWGRGRQHEQRSSRYEPGKFLCRNRFRIQGQLPWLCDGPARAGGIIAGPTAKWKQGPPCSKKQDKMAFFFSSQLLLYLPWCFLFAVNVLSQVQDPHGGTIDTHRRPGPCTAARPTKPTSADLEPGIPWGQWQQQSLLGPWEWSARTSWCGGEDGRGRTMGRMRL